MQAKVDGEVESQSTIDDTNIDITTTVKVIGETPIGDSSIT
jgi:hypothetical protein